MSIFSSYRQEQKIFPMSRLISLILMTLALGVLFLPGLLLAGVIFQDISPDRSTFYKVTDARGASGGRVNGLASVPGTNEVFYAATEWGGLYKTTDGGVTWSHLDRHLPVATWDVEADRINLSDLLFLDIVYATSFYDGRVKSLSGIQVSYNGGDTWIRPPTATPMPGENTSRDFSCSADRISEPSAFGIAIQPDARNNVYVGTNCGLAYSSDYGQTWRFIDPSPRGSNCADGSNACDVWDVVAQPGGIVDVCGDDGHTRFQKVGNELKVVRRGFLPFQKDSSGVPNPPNPFNGRRCSIAASPDEDYVLFVVDDEWRTYGDNHNVWESDDGGKTWVKLGKPYPLNRNPKRLPFVTTNNRSVLGLGGVFDLWYGEESLWRASCTTPNPPKEGGPPRCPQAITSTGIPLWDGPFSEGQGAHGDSGDLVFDRMASVDACPKLYSSDGGVYYNKPDPGSDCHTPNFHQPDVSPHALWLWGMAGSNQPDGKIALHFGVQDDGSWVTPDARTWPVKWEDGLTPDSFTFVADEDRVVWLSQDGLQVQEFPGMIGGPLVKTPTPCLVSFRFINSVDQFGDGKYVVITAKDSRVTGCTNNGVFLTGNISANPVGWAPLGMTSWPADICGVRASVDLVTRGGKPVFYIQAGSCNANLFDNTGDQLWKFVGTNRNCAPNCSWQRIDTNDGMTGGIGIFGVDPHNPDRLYASNLRSPADGGPRMVFSTNGGLTWNPDPKLDSMMTANGFFKYRTERGVTTDVGFAATFPGYPQPSLVAFDPENPDIMVAAGRDSGLFISTNRGQEWGLLTDPFDSGTSGIPHLPRPWFAHFHRDSAGTLWLFVGTQGRGVWRLRIHPPMAFAGGPYIAPAGTPVVLNSGRSSDPDNQLLSFEWDLNHDGNFDDATGPNPPFNREGQTGVFPIHVKVSAGGVFSIADSDVIIVGNGQKTRPIGYWQHQFRARGKTDLSLADLNPYLAIVSHMSKVFNEVRNASTISKATDILSPAQNRGNMNERFDRELLTAWLNFANGAVGLNDPVKTYGDHRPDTTFAKAVYGAESVRLNPGATRQQIQVQRTILNHINAGMNDQNWSGAHALRGP